MIFELVVFGLKSAILPLRFDLWSVEGNLPPKAHLGAFALVIIFLGFYPEGKSLIKNKQIFKYGWLLRFKYKICHTGIKGKPSSNQVNEWKGSRWTQPSP